MCVCVCVCVGPVITMPELALVVGKKGSEFRTDRAKESLFENAVQEQQKTLPLNRVVRNGCRRRGGIWRVARRERGSDVPAAGSGYVGGEERVEDGGKQVERKRQGDR